jgi:putative Holliday junction resolvase
MKTMALDVGDKTIGVAVSDELGAIAFPAVTLVRHEGKRRDMAALRQIVADSQVRAIVVGLPLMLDGSRGVQADKVTEFIDILRNHVRIPIHIQDERLSSVECERVLVEADRPRQARKRVIDSMAAAVILQAYLDRTRNDTRSPEEAAP